MLHLKTLARLELDEAETETLKGDLNTILAYFGELQELDTEGVDELVRPVFSENVFRDDQVESGLDREAVAGLAAEMEEAFFKVPRTLE